MKIDGHLWPVEHPVLMPVGLPNPQDVPTVLQRRNVARLVRRVRHRCSSAICRFGALPLGQVPTLSQRARPATPSHRAQRQCVPLLSGREGPTAVVVNQHDLTIEDLGRPDDHGVHLRVRPQRRFGHCRRLSTHEWPKSGAARPISALAIARTTPVALHVSITALAAKSPRVVASSRDRRGLTNARLSFRPQCGASPPLFGVFPHPSQGLGQAVQPRGAQPRSTW